MQSKTLEHMYMYMHTCIYRHTACFFVAVPLPEEIHGFIHEYCTITSPPFLPPFFPPPLPPFLPPSPSLPSLPPVHQKGESVTGYYRFLTHYGHYVWLQTRGTMMVDRRTGKPSYVVCMHFVIRYSVHVCTYTHSATAVHVCM